MSIENKAKYITGKLSTDLDIGFRINAKVNGVSIEGKNCWGCRLEEVLLHYKNMYEIKDTDDVYLTIKSIK